MGLCFIFNNISALGVKFGMIHISYTPISFNEHGTHYYVICDQPNNKETGEIQQLYKLLYL